MKTWLVVLVILSGLVALACTGGSDDPIPADGGETAAESTKTPTEAPTDSDSTPSSASYTDSVTTSTTASDSSPTCLAVADMIHLDTAQGDYLEKFDAIILEIEEGSKSASESNLREAAEYLVEAYASLLDGTDRSAIGGATQDIVDACERCYPDDLFGRTDEPTPTQVMAGGGAAACFLLGKLEGKDEYTAFFMEQLDGAIAALQGGSMTPDETAILNKAQEIWDAKDGVYSGETTIPFYLIREIFILCGNSFRSDFIDGGRS